ncbi:MAG: glycogen debranching protein [Desulforhopalus sp.]
MSNKKIGAMRKRGYPQPGGVTRLEEGINFTIFARHATRVTLVIDYLPESGSTPERLEFALDPAENRTGDMWHILLAIHLQNFSYGYRIDGTADPSGTGMVYDYSKILIDPYCRALLPRNWGDASEYGQKPCSRMVGQEFDWRDDRPLKTPLSETIIYELHVRGFTRGNNSGVRRPGTYIGIIEKIPYLKDLGVTAVELMPVTEFDENDTVFHHPQTGVRHKNFWGYNPVSFFAINSGYAHDPSEAINEFKAMVFALHQAGIEVYLDMVFNHTGEGGYDGTTSSFRGIDNPIYYLLNDKNEYHNFSGCGNTVNCNHPVVRDLIRESLRYWVTEMHIDGFRFDLASILGRDQQGNVLPNPPMIEVIGQDPVLRDTKMIAEAWDAAGLYQVGSFSTDARWGEWNGRYRDDVRAAMIPMDDTISRLATRIAGSSDLYHPDRSPLCSINFITSHDGFTLYDLVSYNNKNNWSNGEGNRDGDNHNLSWNSGWEGKGCSRQTQTLRFRRMKTFVALLMLSQGVPMILAGDEFGRTQNGNNNSWCQDNDTSWLDWSLMTKNCGFHRFFKRCIQLRKQYTIFRRETFFQSKQANDTGDATEISWQYLTPGQQNWSAECHGLAFHLHGPEAKGHISDFFVMVNTDRSDTLTFILPKPGNDYSGWRQIIDTAQMSPADFPEAEETVVYQPGRSIAVPPFGCNVLQSTLHSKLSPASKNP